MANQKNIVEIILKRLSISAYELSQASGVSEQSLRSMRLSKDKVSVRNLKAILRVWKDRGASEKDIVKALTRD